MRIRKPAAALEKGDRLDALAGVTQAIFPESAAAPEGPKPGKLFVDPNPPAPLVADELVLRQSSVDLFLACPHAFELEKLQKLPSLTTPPMMLGTTGHAVLEKNNRHKVKEGDDLPTEKIIEIWDDTWATNKKEIKEWADDTPDGIQAMGRILLKRYRERVAASIIPRDNDSIEMKMSGVVGGVSMTGTIDLVKMVDKRPVIVDYKFVKAAKRQADAENSIQFGVYAKLTGIHACSYTSLCKTTDPKVESTPVVDRTPKSLAKVENVIASVADSIRKGAFPLADPNDWKCSQKYCGVWWACKQGGGTK